MNRKKITPLIFPFLGLIASIFLHTKVTEICVNIGLSYTLSMIIPYVISFFFVCLLIFKIYQTFLQKSSILARRLVSLGVLVACCGAAFWAHPIYDGDFNNTYQSIYLKGESAAIFESGLTMVALPGCQFCEMRFEEMKKISKDHPELDMHILVIHNDSSAVEWYNRESETLNIRAKTIEGNSFLESILKDENGKIGFPTLFYRQSEKSPDLQKWSNQGFGMAAWDDVVKKG